MRAVHGSMVRIEISRWAMSLISLLSSSAKEKQTQSVDSYFT